MGTGHCVAGHLVAGHSVAVSIYVNLPRFQNLPKVPASSVPRVFRTLCHISALSCLLTQKYVSFDHETL
jgi:hypothetical protein